VGALPPEYSNWGQWIRLFSVNDNELYGNIPTSYETRSWMVRKNNVTFNIENNMFSGDIPEWLAGIIWISWTLYVGNNCLNADLTWVIGNWVDANASLFNPTMFIGSGRRLMQNHCYVPPTPSIPTPITPTSSWWGGGGSSLSKDTCPTGDFSSSYYDKTCWTTADLADEVAKKVNVLKPLIRFIFLTATEEQKRLVYTLITSCSVNNKKEVIKLACQELVETWEF
jgi:hypothetical protein